MEVNPVIISVQTLSGTETESGRSTEPDDTCPAQDNPGGGMSLVERAIRNAVETAKAQGESQMHLLRGKVIQLERALQDKNGEVKKLKDQLEDKDKKLEKSELERKKAEGELQEIKKGLVDLLGKVGGGGSGAVPGNPGSSSATQEASVKMEEDQSDSDDSEASDPPMGFLTKVNQSRKGARRRPFSCEVKGCRGKFGKDFELHFHPRRVHGSKGTSLNQQTQSYGCNQCDETFSRPYQLGAHRRDVHKISNWSPWPLGNSRANKQ